ncbi:selenoprotein TsoY [Carboxylicivirga sp. N1Y90]|uniref:selenoprotein TsoY n=1 Tax=Carboxylicivirga fragile TaxID=3417571 RepID=UPI003D34DABC|nr:hypothetical protein [Marinilabiliaceae bacterium N1Y90]
MKNFNPLSFLASVGSGGIAVAPFVYFQYILPHGKGLITFNQVMEIANTTGSKFAFGLMMAIMVVFSLLHIVLTVSLVSKLIGFSKTKEYKSYISDPQRNTSILAMYTSLGMTFNVFIGVIRFFTPALQSNFQALMLPALIMWSILWLFLMRSEIRILKSAFEKDFDLSKLSFGWLLHPFALGMVTVAGTGIAAMANDPTIAHTAAFMTFTSGSMGLFLLFVKLVSIFKSHFGMNGMPERQFLPSFLIVIPITTLYAITFFRLGHYFEHQFGAHFDIYFKLVVAVPFAFQTWYFAFGISMLKNYFKKDFFRKEYYVTLWAFICPFVGYAVLGSFVHKLFIPSVGLQAVIMTSILTAIAFFVFVGMRYFKYTYPVSKTAIAK